MANFLYSKPSDRITAGTWSLSTGTARTGYPLTNLDNNDPSDPFWANETTIRIVRDMGSALRVDHVDIFAHTFTNAAALKLQMHTSSAWGAPDVSIDVTVPTAYEDGPSYHLHVDVAAAYPTIANRTKRYLSIVTTSANPVTCAIGEIWIGATARELERSVAYGFSAPRLRLASGNKSKRGVSTVYDYGTTERPFQARIPATDADFDDLLALEAATKGPVSPFVVVLAPGSVKNRWAEPVMVRFAEPVSVAPYDYPKLIPVTFSLQELGRGELLGA